MRQFLTLVALAIFVFSCSKSDDPSNQPGPINPNFLDRNLPTGYHCFCWDQKYATSLAAAGFYEVRMVAGTYDYTQTFEIKQGITRRPANVCCDTATSSIYPLDKITEEPPEFFSFVLDTNVVARGDTVHIRVGIPAPSHVQIEISPKSGD